MPAPDFALRATDGATYQLGDLRGVRGLVLGFICNHCPYVVSVTERLASEGEALRKLGFGVAMICSNDAEAYPQDSFENMGLFAAKYGFSFPYLHDPSQDVARAYGAICTPDFFGFDAMLKLQYRGRLDSAGRGAAGPETERELFDAMMRVSRSGVGPATQHPSIGCSIKWKA
jgi:peroxiredoxin